MPQQEQTAVTIERYGRPEVYTIRTLQDAFSVLDELSPADNEACLVKGTHTVEFTYLAYLFESKLQKLGIIIPDLAALERILFTLFQGFRREGDMTPNEYAKEVHVWQAVHPLADGQGCVGVRMHWRLPHEIHAELHRLLRERADSVLKQSATWYGLD